MTDAKKPPISRENREGREQLIRAAVGRHKDLVGRSQEGRELTAITVAVDAVLVALSPAEPSREGLSKHVCREPGCEHYGKARGGACIAQLHSTGRREPISVTGPTRAPGVYHPDGPLGQIRQMADWAECDANYLRPDRETMGKIAANLRAAVAALAAEQEPVEIKAERDRYWQALVDIAGWENWQAQSGPTWREIATAALSGARTESSR